MVLWPIIKPVVSWLNPQDYAKLKEEVRQFFFLKLQKQKLKKSEKEEFVSRISFGAQGEISEFILSLISDFTDSFLGEFASAKDPATVTRAINLLVNQQIVSLWIERLVGQSIAPILIFSIKPFGRAKEAIEIIIRILLAVAQESISSEEAENQTEMILHNNYELAREGVLVIKSLVRTIANFRERNGLEKLAKIGEKALSSSMQVHASSQVTAALRTSMDDPIFDRERITKEWLKNILEPATIALKIGGEELYQRFVENCKSFFELFLDQTLSADDFEKRLNNELKKFGGEEEELIAPIRNAIAGSIKFFELVRVDDPSLRLLLMTLDEERENTKKMCL